MGCPSKFDPQWSPNIPWCPSPWSRCFEVHLGPSWWSVQKPEASFASLMFHCQISESSKIWFKNKKDEDRAPNMDQTVWVFVAILGLWNCWYMLIPVCPACSSCSFFSGYTWTTYDNECRGSEETPCWHRDSEAWATAPGREVTEDDGWQWWSETLAMELIPMWSYSTYTYDYVCLWFTMNYELWLRMIYVWKYTRNAWAVPLRCSVEGSHSQSNVVETLHSIGKINEGIGQY